VHRLSADNRYRPIIGQFAGIGHLTIGIGR